MDGIILTPLRKICHPKGDIFHGLKKSDNGFVGFGEAYFSSVKFNEVKGWKKHTKMTLNLIVPQGEIEFVIFNGAKFTAVRLSQENYQRLTIPPKLWVAFKGVSREQNLLLNIASIEHDPEEAINCELNKIAYDWNQ